MLSRRAGFNTILFLTMLLLFVSVSCSLFLGGDQQNELPVEDTAAQAVTSTLIPTPTETVVLPPTETPLPTLTATPSYDWCKALNTRLIKEADIKYPLMKGDEGFAAISCLVEVKGITREFPEPAIQMKIGFNDKNGILHIYPAVFGGFMYKNSEITGFSFPACYKKDPEMLDINQYTEKFLVYTNPQATPKEFPVFVHTKLGYDNHWPPEASLVNRFEEINQALKNALETGDGFPEGTGTYRLFIFPGLEPCP